MPASYAVLFKIHFWDEFAQRQLARLKRRVGSGDIYIFVDQTNGLVGPIDHPDRFVIRATEADLEILGLPRFGSFNQFWWSADYALHLLALRRPDYAHYVMVEFDLVLNVDLDPVVARIASEGVDFVSGPILDPPIEQFHWLYSAEGVYTPDEAQAWLTCIAIFSRRAVEILRASKVELGRRLAAGEIGTIPMCEIAIPTALALEGCVMRPLGDYGSAAHYRWTPPYDEGGLSDLEDGAFVHPVLSGARFVANILRWYPDHDHFFDETSDLRRRFRSREALVAAIPVIYAAARRERRRDLCQRAIAMMREHGDAETLEMHGLVERNVALGKAATQSSWIGGVVRPEDSSDAVAGLVTGEPAFHTEADANPWWMVDLERPVQIEEVRVFNRMTFRERANGLIVLISETLDGWTEVGRHTGGPFGGRAGKPLVVEVGRRARFVRLELQRRDFLHLDQVQVMGAPA